MDKLSPTQLATLRAAATPEGTTAKPRTAGRLKRLGFVEEREGRLFATEKGREYLKSLEGEVK